MTKQTPRLTPRVQVPEFLKINREAGSANLGDSQKAELIQLREDVLRLENSVRFYHSRCDALQAVQEKMRDPERKAVCDILANGSTQALEGSR